MKSIQILKSVLKNTFIFFFFKQICNFKFIDLLFITKLLIWRILLSICFNLPLLCLKIIEMKFLFELIYVLFSFAKFTHFVKLIYRQILQDFIWLINKNVIFQKYFLTLKLFIVNWISFTLFYTSLRYFFVFNW
jgi:hypothetical protein